jgi:hypothetical protein
MAVASDKRPPLKWPLLAVGGIVLLAAGGLLNAGLYLRLLSLNTGPPGFLGVAVSADVPNDLKFTGALFWVLLAAFLLMTWKSCPFERKPLAIAALALLLWPDHSVGLLSVGGRLFSMLVFLALPLILTIWTEPTVSDDSFSRLEGAWMQRLMALPALIAMIVLPVRVNNYQQLLMSDDYLVRKSRGRASRRETSYADCAPRSRLLLHLPSAARRIPF